MNDEPTCPDCGVPLPKGVFGKSCPRCLFRLGLQEEPANEGPPQAALPRFANYVLLEEISRGGMGVVWKARQPELNRFVAIKTILSGQFAKEEEVHRFRLEAQAAARLRHPNIVAVHEIGQFEGREYFSMEYVEGETLAKLVRDRPLDPQRAVEYLHGVCEAVQYAHEAGVIHRDLKPSNILIDRDNRPCVADFGLARSLDDDSDLTLTGQVLGSPAFIAPEQASGKRGNVGPASDLYAIGAVLYHLLTGRPPFTGPTVESVITQVIQSDPRSLRAG